MTSLSRRSFLASGSAVSVTFAQKQTPAPDIQDAKAPPKRNLLAGRFPPEKVTAALLPREKWRPYPRAAEREQWETLPADLRSRFIRAGEEQLAGAWPIPKATLFLEYVRIGNRANYERELSARRYRLRDLVIAECMEGKGRFLDEIANGVWSICEETWWGYPAHMNLQRKGAGLPDTTEPVIDLFAAEAAALLAWTHYLMAPQLAKVHELIPERIGIEVGRRILVPYRTRNDFWWMGLEADRPMNNWNPWINSNCLACALLMESDAGKRAEMTHKIIRSVDRFLDAYHEDGGCDEGPGYWGHAGGSLFDNLELLHSASAGAIDFYSLPLVKEIGRYIYRVNIADEWYVNFADASARVNIAGDLVYRYGKRIGDENMQLLGAHAAKGNGLRADGFMRFLPALFNWKNIQQAPARQPLVRDAWLPGIQVMTARVKEGSADGLYLAAQGGHNAESHNHNDVGNFIVFANGKPAIIDVGVEIYSAKTFSSRRYEIWTMQSAYHNLPTINGVMQHAGRAFAARNVSHKSDDNSVEFSLDIAAAYPVQAGVEKWDRTLRLDRPNNTIEVRDRYTLQKPGGNIDFTLMTPCPVKRDGSGRITLGDTVQVQFPDTAGVAVDEIKIEDARLQPVWGPMIYRVRLKVQAISPGGEFTVRIVQV